MHCTSLRMSCMHCAFSSNTFTEHPKKCTEMKFGILDLLWKCLHPLGMYALYIPKEYMHCAFPKNVCTEYPQRMHALYISKEFIHALGILKECMHSTSPMNACTVHTMHADFVMIRLMHIIQRMCYSLILLFFSLNHMP